MRQRLKQILHAMKFKDGQSNQSYCSELAIIIQLEAIGEKISDATLVAKLINDLPEKFDTFRETYYIQAASDKTIKFDDIRQQLILIESRRNETSSKSESGDALVTKSQKPSNDKKSNTDKKPRSKIECFKCHKLGYFRKDCRKYKARIAKEQSQGKSTEANQTYSKSLMLACQSAYTVVNGQDSWIGDSGASNHMMYQRNIFTSFEEINDGSFPITVGNNEVIYAQGKGTVDVKSLSGGDITLTNVLYVPKLGRNLLSLGAATKMQVNVKFGKDVIEMSKNSRRLATGHRLPNNLYEMDFIQVNNAANTSVQEATLQVWHERLGHVNYGSVRQLANSSAVEGMKLAKCSTSGSNNCFCEACVYAKQCRQPFNESSTRSTKPDELIHYDIYGPMSVESYGGAKLMAVFVDDYSGFLFVKPMAAKSQKLEAIQEVIAEVKVTGNEVRRTRSDNASEFRNTESVN